MSLYSKKSQWVKWVKSKVGHLKSPVSSKIFIEPQSLNWISFEPHWAQKAPQSPSNTVVSPSWPPRAPELLVKLSQPKCVWFLLSFGEDWFQNIKDVFFLSYTTTPKKIFLKLKKKEKKKTQNLFTKNYLIFFFIYI